MVNEEQAEYWEERTPSWIEVEDWTGLVSGPFGALTIDALHPEPGWRVLDVGCGTGPTTVALAGRVAPGGSVLGVDIAPSMIDAARARADREGAGNAEFRVGDAQSDDFGTGAYDAVFSQLGVMFFADP